MFILLHWYCHRGFGCGKMITFTLKIFNIFGDVYTRDGTISLGQRDASAQIVVSHNYPTQVLGSIPFTPSVVTKWHDRHRYLSIHHMPYLMSLSSPRHCSKTLMWTHCGLEMIFGDIDLSQHWLSIWLVAWQHQAITWTNVDLSSNVFCSSWTGSTHVCVHHQTLWKLFILYQSKNAFLTTFWLTDTTWYTEK